MKKIPDRKLDRDKVRNKTCKITKGKQEGEGKK